MRDPLQQDLIRWAKWREKERGFSGSTTIARAMAGGLESGNFHSDPPRELEPSGWLQKLDLAMANAASVPRKARYIRAMQLHYILGRKGAENVLGKPSSTIRRWRGQGEAILRRELDSM